MEPMLAQVNVFSGNFAPRGWADCDGSLQQIEQNQALFALVGTTAVTAAPRSGSRRSRPGPWNALCDCHAGRLSGASLATSRLDRLSVSYATRSARSHPGFASSWKAW